MKPFRFFVDFDGTITKNDVVDLVLERFASKEWKKVEAEWTEGKIGSRECLSRQIALVSANDDELGRLLDQVKIDPSFVSFVKTLSEHSIPLAIVSDGFDRFIEAVLGRVSSEVPGLFEKIPVFSNKLRRVNGSLQVKFFENSLCEHACANCKERVVRHLKKPGEFSVFIGDGLSDRYGAEAVDLAFAKGKLLAFCKEQGIAHLEYTSFKDVEEWLLQKQSRENSKIEKSKPISASKV